MERGTRQSRPPASRGAGLTPRVRRLLEGFHAAQPEVFAERAVLVTQAYQETEGRPMPLRRAAALERVLEGGSVLIRDGELIVGCKTPAVLGSPLYPEIACDWVENELESIALRPEAPFAVSEGTKDALRADVFHYWKGRQICDRILEALPPGVLQATDEGLFFHYYMNRSIGHITVDYRAVLEKGFLGLRGEVRRELGALRPEQPGILKRIHELRAMERCCAAAIAFADRYAFEAAEMAAMEAHPVRRRELAEIARVCGLVPANPAATFREALQSFWFVHLILNLETNSYAISPGRFDQYLYPYYAADLEAGRLTRDGARELLSCLWLKLNELTVVKEGGTAKASTTYNDFQNLNVGGQLADGRDAVNDLSYLCVEVAGLMQLPQPQVSALISEKTPEQFLQHCCRVIRSGLGMPSVFNDDEKVQSMLHKGRSLADARLGSINGCVELNVQGKDSMASSGYLNLCKCLELALNDGVNPLTGTRLGPRTGRFEDMGTFPELMDALRLQIRHALGLKLGYDYIARAAYAEYCPVPFTSLLISDCISTGLDYHDGGSHYSLPMVGGVGVGTAADSLAAIRKLVFEDAALPAAELSAALLADFAGSERTRLLLQQRAPKWGNGDDFVDTLAHDLVEIFCDELEQHRNERGVPYVANMIPTTTHVWFGALTGATADGRHAEAPLSEGISPVQGTDRNGPTAVVRSMARLDQVRCCGTLLNMKFHPSALEGDDGVSNLAHLIRAYFTLGGHHIQFNVVSADTLRAAQAHPEEYRTLLVRVAGYSDYFGRLSRELQDEIISRTEQGF
jgi:trans-4-hydroxy-L-proline dehydratase